MIMLTFKQKRKLHRGTKAFKEIKRYQRSIDFLIAKLAFGRLVREIMHDIRGDLRSALEALQESAEAFLTILLESKCSFQFIILYFLTINLLTVF